MRVVFLTHNYPRDPADAAGAFLRPLATALAARGHDLRVVAPSDQGRGGREPLDGIPVRRVRYGSASRERYAYSGRMHEALRSPAGVLAFARMLGALRRGARYEAAGALPGEVVVHAHWWVPGGLAAPPDLPAVVTLHGTDGALLDRSALSRMLARRVLQRCRAVTAVSRPLAERAARATALAKPVRVLPMPVPSAGWPWRTGGGGLLILGRLTAQKRVDLALRAAAIVQAQRPVRIRVVGDGPERPGLEKLAHDLGLGPATEFTGSVPPATVPALIAEADAGVFTAVGEGLGLAAAEMLMVGVPVVACRDGGGVLDVVSATGAGRVVDPEPRAIAGALLDVLDNRAALETARSEGHALRERLTPEATAAGFEALYQAAVRG